MQRFASDTQYYVLYDTMYRNRGMLRTVHVISTHLPSSQEAAVNI